MPRLHSKTRAFANPKNFYQVLNQAVPPERRQQLAEEHAYDWRARKIFFSQHFAALTVHRISRDHSLRQMGKGVRGRFLYSSHGAHMAVSNAALSKAHEARPADVYLDVLDMVMEALSPWAKDQGLSLTSRMSAVCCEKSTWRPLRTSVTC